MEIESEGRRVASILGAEYWAVSSKTGEGVNDLFSRIAALAFNRAVQTQGHHKAKRHSKIHLPTIGNQ